MQSLSNVRHHLLERSPLVAGGDLVLGYGKFAEQVKLQLELRVPGHGHHDHVALTILGYKDGLIQFVGEVRYLVCLVAQVGNGFDDRHGSSLLLHRQYYII